MRRHLTVAAAAALSATMLHAGDRSSPAALVDSESWQAIRYDVLGDTVPGNGSGLFSVEAPVRADDAATVPVRIVQTDPLATIRAATVVIDENPAPVAASLTFGEAMGPLDFELRVRVNQYSNVRVIAETERGSFMAGRYVKASGGCSAPASHSPEAALAGMGDMRLRRFPASTAGDGPGRAEAQIMIRHPNYSGLQRDQVTHLFIPAHFIDHIEVYQGDALLFALDGGISVSENPVFRFRYSDDGTPALTVRATDTEGNRFEAELAKAATG